MNITGKIQNYQFPGYMQNPQPFHRKLLCQNGCDTFITSFKSNSDETEEKLALRERLRGMKDLDGSVRFSQHEINQIMIEYDSETKEPLEILLRQKTFDGNLYRFTGAGIANIMNGFMVENKELLGTLIAAPNINDDDYRFDEAEIALVLNSHRDETCEILDLLLDYKTLNKKNYRFNGIDLPHIMAAYMPGQKQLLEEILSWTYYRKGKKMYMLNGFETAAVLRGRKIIKRSDPRE